MKTRPIVLGILAGAPAAATRASSWSGSDLVSAARRKVGVTKGYDSRYHTMAYPGGDLALGTGVCADVVVRAARDAWGADLQQLVHEDMTRAFAAYPKRWGLKHPDSNIDHRRVPNLEPIGIARARAFGMPVRAPGGQGSPGLCHPAIS